MLQHKINRGIYHLKKGAVFLLFILVQVNAFSNPQTPISSILIEVKDGHTGETKLIAIDQLRELSNSVIHVVESPAKKDEREKYDVTIILGASNELPVLQEQWKKHAAAKNDAWLLQTVSTKPLVVMASGINERAMLYAAYHLADLLKAGANISDLNLFYEPKVEQRYVSYGTTTHGRRFHQPSLYFKNLKELPRYGYNGVLIYPGGGTPIGRRASPVLEAEDGKLYNTPQNTQNWHNWFREVDKYKLDILMTIPPMVPPGYTNQEIKDFYGGGPEPKEYIQNLKKHYREFLTLLKKEYPEVDVYMFNSTEGATFGSNERFFGHPDVKRFSNKTYLANNEKIMKAYFDVLSDFFKEDLNKVSFWTHSFGLTSEGIAKMREVLFQYPQVLILEDDYWNNNLWPMNIPPMKYLPEGLRAKIHTKNPFGMFQIVTDGEYYGGGSLPNAYAGSHIRSSQDAIARNARLVIQRLDLHDRTQYGTLFGTMEIVPIVASKYLWSPTPPEAQIWQDWATRRFGPKAAPHVVKALQESENILLNGLSCNGIDLLAVGSEFASRLWMKSENGLSRYHLFSKPGRKFVDKTENDVVYSEEYTAYQMDTHSIPMKTFRANQASAMASVHRGLAEVEKAKPHLRPEDYTMLKNIFLKGQEVLTALQLLGEAAYATNLLESNFDKVKDPQAQYKLAMANLGNFINTHPMEGNMNKNLALIYNDYQKVGSAALARKK